MSTDAPSGTRRIGPYEIHEVLGRGGMGVVYRGVSPAGEEVAVKQIIAAVLTEEDTARFAAEIDTLKLVHGTRVVDYLDAGIDMVGKPWLAVRFVPGPTLRSFVGAVGPMEPVLVAILGASLLDGGLRQIHAAGVLHRDLKPHNIILADDGPVLIDFGLALLTAAKVHHAEDPGRITSPGTVVGTLVCMPPEQVYAKELTAAADVYALGATLLYAATGHYPYDAPSPYGFMQAISSPLTRPDMSGLPAALVPVITAMLAKDLADRPDVETARDLLVQIVAEAGFTAVRARALLRRVTADWVPLGPEPGAESTAGRGTNTPRPRRSLDAATSAGSADMAVKVARALRDAYARDAAF